MTSALSPTSGIPKHSCHLTFHLVAACHQIQLQTQAYAHASTKGDMAAPRACFLGHLQLSARASALQVAAACAYSRRSSGITLCPSSCFRSSSARHGSDPCHRAVLL